MNVELRSAAFAEVAAAAFQNVIARCIPITSVALRMRESKFQKLYNWFAYHIVRTSLLLLTFTSHKRFWGLSARPKEKG